MLKNSPSDLKIETDKLTGFYRGVVEDNVDPKKAGRIRVRVFGLHTEKKLKVETEGIPTEELPWAEPCLPIIEGSISGFGMWGIPLQGSHVMLFFENENLFQPRYFASMPGIPESKNSLKKTLVTTPEASSKKEGFRDPDGVYPREDKLGEPDVHRLARGISEGTLVETKEENLDQAIQMAYGGSWDEPDPPYNAKYPHNFVFTTHGGLTVELDSTPGAKRFHIYHPSNTYIECDNDGNLVIRNQADKYEIIMQSKYVHIINDHNITVDADERAKVKGNKFTEINEDEDRRVDGDRRTEIRGDDTEVILGDKSKTVSGDDIEVIGGDKSKTVSGEETDSISGDKTELIGGDLTITVTGNVTLISPDTTITGGQVHLGAQTTMRDLMDERMMSIFNSHIHGGVEGGDNFSAGPTTFLSKPAHTTSNVEAS
jgi:hypothetical protein